MRVDPLAPGQLTPQVRDRLERIYRASFPPSERQHPDRVFDLSGGRQLLVARDRDDDEIFGLASIVTCGDAALLDYLAVAPDARNGGVGGVLLDQSLDLLERQGLRMAFMELEPPGSPGASPFAERRVDFYQRHGCERVDWVPGFWIPSFSDATQRLPMLLYWKRFGDLSVTPQPAAFSRLYRLSYPQVSSHDAPRAAPS